MTATVPSGYDPLASAGDPADAPPEPLIRMAAPVTGEEEVEAVREVLASGVLTNGPFTRQFEAAMADLHGTDHAVAFANGTVALSGMYLASGIGPGHEVIVPSLTFISTATSVLHAQATPVFADICPDTLNLDPDDVARRITPNTKAIVPVHYGGQAADLERLRQLADDAGVALLEDAAQAHGASFQGRPVGSWGQAGMFSFTPTKNITTGEGSVVTTDDEELAQHLRLLRNHGITRQYHHELVGWNWRLSEMQAAIGCVQVTRLHDILATKARNAEVMRDLLEGIEGVEAPVNPPDRDHPYMLYTVQIADGRRDHVSRALTAAGIENRIYFPPAHRQPIFAHLPDPELPVTEAAADRILSLPFHSRLRDQDLAFIAEVLQESLES
jgi:perosamine synthetase